jgi:hypothetical protein
MESVVTDAINGENGGDLWMIIYKRSFFVKGNFVKKGQDSVRLCCLTFSVILPLRFIMSSPAEIINSPMAVDAPPPRKQAVVITCDSYQLPWQGKQFDPINELALLVLVINHAVCEKEQMEEVSFNAFAKPFRCAYSWESPKVFDLAEQMRELTGACRAKSLVERRLRRDALLSSTTLVTQKDHIIVGLNMEDLRTAAVYKLQDLKLVQTRNLENVRIYLDGLQQVVELNNLYNTRENELELLLPSEWNAAQPDEATTEGGHVHITPEETSTHQIYFAKNVCEARAKLLA